MFTPLKEEIKEKPIFCCPKIKDMNLQKLTISYGVNETPD